MIPNVPVSESRLISYKQTLELAKNQLITLGGDDRKCSYGDKIQGGMLDLIDFILIDMEDVMNSVKEKA